jgi:hypothetical protein
MLLSCALGPDIRIPGNALGDKGRLQVSRTEITSSRCIPRLPDLPFEQDRGSEGLFLAIY